MARGRSRGSNAYDQALKLLGEVWAPDLAALLFPGAQLDEALSGDLPATERRADWLWRAHLQGAPCVLHVEFQLRAKPDVAERMFGYASRILTQYHLPPAGVLVYLIPVPHPVTPPFQVELGGQEVLRYAFQVVRLWELDPAPLLAAAAPPRPGLLPLVPLMRGATPEQVPTLAERVLQVPGMGRLQRADLLGILTTLGSLRFPQADIWSLLRRDTMLSELLDELIEDSPFLRRLHQEALAEGETKGRQEGEAVGRAAEARALIREVVRARFAGIAPEELAGVDALADAERLHALALALVSAPDEAAARRALADAKA